MTAELRNLPHIASMAFNEPLMLEPAYARVFFCALAGQLGISRLTDAVSGDSLTAGEAPATLALSVNDDGPRQARSYQVMNGIAVLPVSGTLVSRTRALQPYSGMTGYNGIIARLQQAASDPMVDGILLDLGVSSPQLDDGARGFSYMADAPLDMRMDKDDALTAGEVVNTWPQGELRRILYDYGEERYAPQIAAAICRAREKAPIETTLELVDIIRSAMPAQALREKQHPAKRSFQAIRIAVNDELGAVSRMMQAAVGRLNPGGRLAVITFHSLEDRIVKSEMQQAARGCTCPPEFPVCVCGKKPLVKLVTRKPIVSGPAELEENPRARSAKLRVAEKL